MPKFSAIFEANWLPAILVKESRQFVRSRLVVWVLLLEMLGFAVLTSVLLYQVFWTGNPSRSPAPGPDQLRAVAHVLLLALALAAFDGLLRTAREHDDRHSELMLATGLSPWEILWGKLLSGWTLAALVLSAGLPFLQLAYMMRGVSVVMLGWVALLLLLYALLSVVLAQAVAKLSLPGFLRRLGGLALLLWQAFFFGDAIRSMFRRGVGFAVLSNVGGVGLLAGVVLLVLAWFFFSPPRPRRTRLARWWFLALYAAIFLLLTWIDRSKNLVLAILAGIAIAAAIFVLALECPEFLPGKGARGGRFLPWSDGVANGIGLGFLMVGIPNLFLLYSSPSGLERVAVSVLFMTCAFLALSAGLGWMLSRLAARRFQRRPPPLVMAAGVGLLQLVLLVVLGSAGCFENSGIYIVEFLMSAAVILMLLAGVFLSSLFAGGGGPEIRKPEPSTTTPPPSPSPETLRQRLFAEDWLLRPLSRWEGVNPVFLKEIRQLWRSRSATWLLWLCGGTIIYYLLFIILGWGSSRWSDGWSGLASWSTLAVPLTAAAIQFHRSLEEKSSLDLLCITGLTPGQVFRGKLFSSVAIGLAASVPPLLFLYALLSIPMFAFKAGGIPWWELALGLARLVIVSGSATAVALALAWVPMADFYKRYLLGPAALAAFVLLPRLHKIAFGLQALILVVVGLAATYAAVRWYRRTARQPIQQVRHQ